MKTSKKLIDACLASIAISETCITEAINSGNKEFASIGRDCAEISALCARFEARGSVYSQELLELCSKINTACSIESSKNASRNASFKECAEICRKSADIATELAGAYA